MDSGKEITQRKCFKRGRSRPHMDLAAKTRQFRRRNDLERIPAGCNMTDCEPAARVCEYPVERTIEQSIWPIDSRTQQQNRSPHDRLARTIRYPTRDPAVFGPKALRGCKKQAEKYRSEKQFAASPRSIQASHNAWASSPGSCGRFLEKPDCHVERSRASSHVSKNNHMDR